MKPTRSARLWFGELHQREAHAEKPGPTTGVARFVRMSQNPGHEPPIPPYPQKPGPTTGRGGRGGRVDWRGGLETEEPLRVELDVAEKKHPIGVTVSGTEVPVFTFTEIIFTLSRRLVDVLIRY